MNRFLTLTAVLAFGLTFSAFADEKPSENIVDTAAGNEDFSSLVAAIKAADLVDTLSGPGPFSVFAPTNEKLAGILTYHVVAGKVMAENVKPGSVETVNGKSATITVEGDTVKIDGATIVNTDIKASNGVIHVIDAVILPAE
ncbi:MAG: fasciclin domain-containing protein [Verrucomicrobiia bacterium]